jgi:hypothetical protein
MTIMLVGILKMRRKSSRRKKYLIFYLEEIIEALSLSSQKQSKFLQEIEELKKDPSSPRLGRADVL